MNTRPREGLRITVLIDNPNSWVIPYAEKLQQLLHERGHKVEMRHEKEEVGNGDILLLLSCEKIVPKDTLTRNTHNIVVHSSDLPQGQGFSPLTWLVLEGANDVPITLFEAVDAVDAGPFYFKDTIHFEGHELNGELKAAQGEKTIELILRFVDAYPNAIPHEQRGDRTWYRRRTAADSELDTTKGIGEQFDLLRVVDNERYPAFFTFRGHTYILKIYKPGDEKKSA